MWMGNFVVIFRSSNHGLSPPCRREAFLEYYQQLLPGSGSGAGSSSPPPPGDWPQQSLRAALDGHVLQRFIGQRNLQTDIKVGQGGLWASAKNIHMDW